MSFLATTTSLSHGGGATPSGAGGPPSWKNFLKHRISPRWHWYFEHLDPRSRPVPLQEERTRNSKDEENKVETHAYADFSNIAPPTDCILPEGTMNSFPYKLHAVLSHNDYSHTICWMPHGRAFRGRSAKSFEVQVCPRFIGHSNVSVFWKELRKHGFKAITKGQDKGCFYHELF